MTTLHFFVAALATWQIVEIWNHSPLFASQRAWTEVLEGGIRGWFGSLMMCPWCLSVWVAWFTTAWLFAAAWFDLDVVAWPLYGFAVSRLANLGNDVFKDYCRTPTQEFDIPDLEADSESV